MIGGHVKNFLQYSGECEYQLHYRSKDKDKPLGVANIYHPPCIEKLKKIKNLEKGGSKLYKNR